MRSTLLTVGTFVALASGVAVLPPARADVTSCGTWAELISDQPVLWSSSHITVYDSARGRMLIFGGENSATADQVWALSLGDPPTLEQIPTQGTVHAGANAAGIYDPVRDRLVVFGGSAGTGDAFALDLSSSPATWNVIPVSGPSPLTRPGLSAIYDTARDRMVIFGGGTLFGAAYSDAWALSFSGTPSWAQLSPSGTTPDGRAYHSAIYDAARDRMVVCGGTWNSRYYSEVWALSLAGSGSWSQIQVAGAMPPRFGHAAVVSGDQMLVFSGWNGGNGLLQDTWSLNLANNHATQLFPTGPTPTPTRMFAGVYDPIGQRLIASLGDQFWSLGNLAGVPSWSELEIPGALPAPRTGSACIYDSARQRLVLFGGLLSGPGAWLSDVWAFSLLNGTWSRIVSATQGPFARDGASAIYDPTGDRMILFGGQLGPGTVTTTFPRGPQNDTWALSLAGTPSWTQLSPGGGIPFPRYGHTAILDPPGNRMIVLGGVDAQGRLMLDPWSLDLAGGTTWSQVIASGPTPAARAGHTSVFDSARDRMLVFGGASDNSVWALSLAGAPQWAVITATGTSPPLPFSHVAAYDAVRDRMLVAMGTSGTSDAYELRLSGTPHWGLVGSSTTAPAPRVSAGSVYDPASDRWVLFGGKDPTNHFRNDTQALSTSNAYPLTVNASPPQGGSIQRSSPTSCQEPGSMVTLTAVPAPSYGFTGWSGDASGTENPLTVTMDAAKNITANFTGFVLTTQASPSAGGTIGRNPNLPSFPPGSQVTLTATPASAYTFTGWSGDASGTTNPLTVTMDAAKNITANFLTYGLTTQVSPAGSGSVGRSPNMLSYPPGSQVILTATPSSAFVSWSGDASGNDNPLTVTMDAAKSITAHFNAFTVTVAISPAGSGTVTKDPNQPSYPPGTQVTLTAVPGDGNTFTGWSGDASGTNNPLSLDVDADKNVTASFATPPPVCGNWTTVTNTGVLRAGPAVAWDPVNSQVLRFGGYDGNVFLNDLWSFTLALGWTQLSPTGTPPSPRDAAVLFYDPVRSRMLLIGGNNNVPPSDVWALSLSGTPAWTQIATSGPTPAGRFAFSAVYDPVRDRVLRFGGYPVTNELWELSLSGTPTWTLLSPAGTPPSGRFAHAAIYDPVRDRMVIHAGFNNLTTYSDTWALSLSGTPTWTQLAPLGDAPAVYATSAAYDPIRDRMLVVSGYNPTGLNTDAVWSLSLKSQLGWIRLPTGGVPMQSRYLCGAVYEPDQDLLLAMNGIGTYSYLADVKRLDCAGGYWLETAGDHGTVSESPTKACFASGETVSLQPIGQSNYAFQSWLGDASGNIQPIDVTMDGNKVIFAQFYTSPVGVGDAPLEFALEEIRPNPNPGPVTIAYSLPVAARVRLAIYDVAGRQTSVLASGVIEPGRHTARWDGRANGAKAKTGVYFVRYETPVRTWNKRLVLLR